jgi:diacylglycerol kinase (ATP)
VLVIVNPAAWRTRTGDWRRQLDDTLSPTVRVTWATPGRAEDVGPLVRRARGEGVRAVIVAGGDGTVSRAIEALAGTDTLLGLIPLGTGNDLARELGWPTEVDAAIPRLLDGRERVLDLVEVNGRPYATVGLIGLTAGSVVRVLRWQAHAAGPLRLARLLGRQVYRVSALLSLVAPGRAWTHCRYALANAEAGEVAWEGDVFGFFIANGRRLGSGLVLPLDARPADGVFEVAAVRRVHRLKLLWAFACFAQGWRVPEGVLDVRAATHAAVDWPSPTVFSADGELLCRASHFDLRLRPRALSVIS